MNYDLNVSRNPFQSFRMAGFECADHQNAFGNRVDFYKMTGHDRFLNEDYAMLDGLKMKTVREGIRWSEVEKIPYQYNWTEVDRMLSTAESNGIQIVWDICHFGFPDDLTPLHPMFARRFAHLCENFVRHYRTLYPTGELIITPINEVSFLSWLGGDARGTSPYCINLGWEVKYALMKAYIEGIERMFEVDSSVRIMTTEPLINIVPADPTDALGILNAEKAHQEQFQVLDILSGRMCPELRGKPEYLDIIGVNFYFNNQWKFENHQFLPWGDVPPHPQWKPLSALIQEVFLRYGRPIVLSETSHPHEHRPNWIAKIGEECRTILASGIPFWGCCIYPIIDRPDWDFTEHWHRSGVWDIYNDNSLQRIVHQETFDAVNGCLPY